MKLLKITALLLPLLNGSLHAGELGDLLLATLRHPQVRAAGAQQGAVQAQLGAATGCYFRNHGSDDDRNTWTFGGVVSLPLEATQYKQA